MTPGSKYGIDTQPSSYAEDPAGEKEEAKTIAVGGQVERKWPGGWRPYMALLAGFCAMANCWYY